MPKYAQRNRRKQRTTKKIQPPSIKPTVGMETEAARVVTANRPGAVPRTFSNELERHIQIRRELKTIGVIGGSLLIILIIAALLLR
jgi:hypothetical protein